jgi:phosphatidylethanolamine N-methyltransferase
MWVPVHDEEWDGDIPIGDNNQTSTPADREASDEECGTVVFKGDSLPWTVGHYEMRYHHDGKYNVLALEGPIEIYGVFSVFSLSGFRLLNCINRCSSGPPRKSRL